MSNHLLLVEDSPTDVKLTLRGFQKCKLAESVVVVNDGVEALDYLFARGSFKERDPSDLPALVLLDLKLPRLDGLEVLRAIRASAQTKHQPVVILTASREDADIDRSYELGANAYIRKPIDFTVFTQGLQTLGQFWLLLNQPPRVR